MEFRRRAAAPSAAFGMAYVNQTARVRPYAAYAIFKIVVAHKNMLAHFCMFSNLIGLFRKMKKSNLIMLGAPGSGKGTRAVALCEVLGIVQVATGDLFRNNLKGGTELGKLAKSYMDKGELVPDDVTAAMVKDRLLQPDVKKDSCSTDSHAL